MGFFSRKKPQTVSPEQSANSLAATAVEYAADFHHSFDYTEESLAGLEEILEYYHQDLAKSKPTDNQIWSMALIFGAYLGECVLRHGGAGFGYVWRDAGNELILKNTRDGSELAPVSKAYKRLVNGGGDNVVSFYRFAMYICAGGSV